MKTYSLLGNFIDAEPHLCYLIPSYTDHLLLGFFSVSILSFLLFYSFVNFWYYFIFIFRVILASSGIAPRTLTALVSLPTQWRTNKCFHLVLSWIAYALSTSVCQNTLPSLNFTLMATTEMTTPNDFLDEFSMICQ